MSALSKFAGSVLLQAGGSYEPQRKSNFALIIEGDGLDNLILQLKDVDIPAITLTQKGIKYFNETMHYAGSVTPFADLTVNYHDYIDRNGLALLSAWYKQGFDPKTGAIGWAKDYKKNGQLLMLPPGIAGVTPGAVSEYSADVRSWKLQGLWIKGFKPDMFDHDNDGDNTLLNVVFSVDRAFPEAMET